MICDISSKYFYEDPISRWDANQGSKPPPGHKHNYALPDVNPAFLNHLRLEATGKIGIVTLIIVSYSFELTTSYIGFNKFLSCLECF